MGVVCCFANAKKSDSFQGEHSSAAVVVAILAVYELTLIY